MATATAGPRAVRGTAGVHGWVPWAGLALWAAGAVGVWHLAGRYGWSPGELVLAGCGWLGVLAVAARDAVRGMFGPVFAYEVTRLGRRRLTVVLRLLYVLFVLAVLGVMYLGWLENVGYFRRGGPRVVPSDKLSGFATEFFYVFLVVQYVAVTVLTPATVAGSVADEKERKTLEFLLATDLRNREIVFGKLAARGTTLLMYVLAGLPVVAFLQLFGGIDPDQLLAGVAATVVTVLGLAAVSLACSVAVKRPRDAIALAYLSVFVYAVGSFLLAVYVMGLQRTLGRAGGTTSYFGYEVDLYEVLDRVRPVTDGLAAGNVLYVIPVLRGPFGGGLTGAALGDALFRYAAFWGVVTAACLGYAVWRLRAVALAQSYGAPKRVRERRARRRPAVGDDPMVWKEVFVDGGIRGGCVGRLVGLAVVGLVFVIPAVMVWNTFLDPDPITRNQSPAKRWEDFAENINGWCRGATGVVGFLLMMAACVRGAAAVSGERDRDTWVSLISTPLTAWDMVKGKWLGCVLGLRRGFLVLAGVWAVALASGAVYPVMAGVAAAAVGVYVGAFAWVGILCSVTARTTLVATVRAIMAGLFLAGGFWFFVLVCCALPVNTMSRGTGRDFEYVWCMLLGWTPPFVAGWLPLNGFGRWDLGPFSWDSGDRTLGPIPPAVGLAGYVVLNAVLGTWAWEAFKRVTNRARDELAGRLPRPPARSTAPPPLPVARPTSRPPAAGGDQPIILE